MLPINSLSGALAQSTQIQLEQAAEKNRQARKARELARNVAARAAGFAATEEELEQQVENSEELTPIHDQGRQGQEREKHKFKRDQEKTADDSPADGLDLKA